MKKIVIIFFIVFFSVLLSAWLFLRAYEHKSIKEQHLYKYALSEHEIKRIHEGDIILRHGYGLVSDLIVEQLKEQYDISHCAVVCKTDTGFSVVHSVSSSISNVDGVQAQDLKSFIEESHFNSVIVVRYKPKINKNNSFISSRALNYLDQKIPFDESFNINDSTEFYCTELLWKIFLNEFGDDVFQGKDNIYKDHLKFDTFLDSTRFEIIINHHLRKSKN